MKNLITILIILAIIVIGNALVGMYKFNYLSNQPWYDVDGNKIQTENISKDTEEKIISETLQDISDIETEILKD